VTTVAPLYLVSACDSGEEFVAAFRRYVDRTGVFVPMASPLPQNRRGRIALTLKDGSVMIEGEAEIVQSSPKSLLYGRGGIVVKFIEPDEPSKVMLTELDKARLAMKPAAPSIAPRPADVPAEPRPVPPAIGGRIDAANALAESVAIGDVSALKEVENSLPKAGQKFVVPTIPDLGGRARTPSSIPPSIAIPALRPPDPGSGGVPAIKTDDSPSTDSRKMTQIGFPVVKMPADPGKPIEPPRVTTLGVTPLRVTQTQSTGVVPPPPTFADASEDDESPFPQPTPTSPRAKSGTSPPRHPTPAAPLPVTRIPAKPAPMLETDEKTELTAVPTLPPSLTDAVPVLESEPVEPRAEEPRPQRSGGMRASEILAAVQVDDWTMTPDALGPTVIPTQPKPAEPKAPEPGVSASATPPAGPPSGDWTISLDGQAGWSAPPTPAGIEKRIPKSPQTPSTGNPVMAVASDKPIEAVRMEDKPTSIGEKIEIDPTLMGADDQPGAAIEPPDQSSALIGQMGPMSEMGQMGQMGMSGVQSAPITEKIPPPLSAGMPPPVAHTHGFAPAGMPGNVPAPPFGYPSPPPSYQPYDSGSVAATRSKRRRILVIVGAFVAASAVGVFALSRKHGSMPAHAGSAAPPAPAVSAPTVASPGVTAEGSAKPQLATGSDPTKPNQCSVEVISTPPGADVSLDDDTVLGTTPGTFALPCGTEVKLTLKKPKFLNTVRTLTPAPDGTKVAVTLGVAQFTVKITSTPAGATITIGGKSRGVTPSSMQLPAFTTQAITLTKDGYQTDNEKLVVKSNGLLHHVVLKKGTKHH
jgi:hypothetical protein